MKLLDPLRVHRRCNGTGTFQATSGPAFCFPCSGTGKIPSARDQRRLAAEETRRYGLLQVMYAPECMTSPVPSPARRLVQAGPPRARRKPRDHPDQLR